MKSAEEQQCCSQCCTWCVRNCLHLGSKQKSKRYAGIHYELLPRPQADLQRSYVLPQPPTAHHTQAIILPKEMQSVLRHGIGRHESQFAITQQPTSMAASSSGDQVTHGGDPRDSSSSLSESTPPLLPTPLRSQGGREETIDISQSPTGTFSSAYRHAQRKGYASQHSHSLTKNSSTESGDSQIGANSGITISGGDNSPSLDLSVYYNVHSESLSIYLHCARHLPQKSSKNYSLILHFTPDRFETLEMKIAGDDCNPSLSHSFEISNLPRDDVRSHQLLIRLHDGSAAGDLLCGTTIPLEGTDLFGMMFTVLLDPSTDKVIIVLFTMICRSLFR